MFDSLDITSPKQKTEITNEWNSFFPYYAGYPEAFARAILLSSGLPKGSTILDPWNGSGTTTYAAMRSGFNSHGFDLNPVMVVIAKARSLPPSEADAIKPLAMDLAFNLRARSRTLAADDPLLQWFTPSSAAVVRTLEMRIRKQLVGDLTITDTGPRLENISGIAATMYVALFSIARSLAASFKTSNPTWMKLPKLNERVFVTSEDLVTSFVNCLSRMSTSLLSRKPNTVTDKPNTEIRVADSTSFGLEASSVDMVLTSPPYCTRIDYSAATRIELAVLWPLTNLSVDALSRRMIGSVRVPLHEIEVSESWGDTCATLIQKIRAHPSKASSGYYLKTHLDYFQKLAKSLIGVSNALKPNGAAILVVQDSHYKDVYNDLSTITAEMAASAGLRLRRREDFVFKRSMARVNRYSKMYGRTTHVMESVLCFEKVYIDDPVTLS